MTYDVLIIGAGAAGLSCALVLGSANNREYVSNKTIGIIAHQKNSHLHNALFNNVLGFKPGTTGASILKTGISQLQTLYPHINQIKKEKVLAINKQDAIFIVDTNKNQYESKIVVIAAGYTNLLTIKGLDSYIEAHPRSVKEKQRIWLRNTDHLVDAGLYVAGTLAGWRSQFSIAAGSGAHVATDILTAWNGGKHTKVHDKAGA